MAWGQFQLLFLSLCVVGWLIAIARFQRVAADHPEHRARQDAFHLFTLLFVSATLVVIRERVANPSIAYWALNGLLVPVSVLVILKVSRLFQQYRRESR